MKRRIANFLGNTLYADEFAHTILHSEPHLIKPADPALKAGERTCPTPVDLRPLSPPNPRELTEQCVETFYKKVCPERLKKRDFLRNVMRHPDQVIIARCLKAYGTAPTPLKPAAGGDDTF